MFKQNEPVVPALQHRLCFFKRAGMIEFCRQSASPRVKDFPDEKEVLLLATYQQDS
jgi:hypothetical protein